jgi:hypothetical protein
MSFHMSLNVSFNLNFCLAAIMGILIRRRLEA